MSEIEDKILGKENKNNPTPANNYFAADVIWVVSKEGCGSCFFNGQMVYEMLSADGKRKARRGQRKIFDNGFVFKRSK